MYVYTVLRKTIQPAFPLNSAQLIRSFTYSVFMLILLQKGRKLFTMASVNKIILYGAVKIHFSDIKLLFGTNLSEIS